MPRVFDGFAVTRRRGTDEDVIRDVGLRSEILATTSASCAVPDGYMGPDFEYLRAFVAEWPWLGIGPACCLLDLHAVLVCARDHDSFSAFEHLISLEDVREDHRVEVTDMGGFE